MLKLVWLPAVQLFPDFCIPPQWVEQVLECGSFKILFVYVKQTGT
jgi:hypothetical protein